jgi:hypothetical protein
MSSHEHPIVMPVRNAGAGSSLRTRAKAVALETVQTLSGTARDALFAYAMMGARWQASPSSPRRTSRCCCAASSTAVDKRAQVAYGVRRD